MRELEPDSYWTQDTELLAAVVEGLHVLIGMKHQLNFKTPHPDPVEIPRPWDGKKRKGTTMAELQQMAMPITPKDP